MARRKQLPEETIVVSSSLVEEKKEEEKTQPVEQWWFQELHNRYLAGLSHCFVVYGNIWDYVHAIPGRSMKKHIFTSYPQRDVVVYWHQAQGFEFASPEMEERFISTLGLSDPGDYLQFDTTKPIVALSLLTEALRYGRTKEQRDAIIAHRLAEPEKQKEIQEAIEEAIYPIIQRRDYNYISHHEARIAIERVTNEINEKYQKEASRPFRMVVALDYPDTVIPRSDSAPMDERKALIHILQMARDKTIGERGHTIFMMAPSVESLHADISRTDSCWTPIEVPLPSAQEREKFLTLLLEQNTELRLAEGTSLKEISELTPGLSYLNLEDLALQAQYLKEPISLDLVRWRKKEIIRQEYGDLIEVYEKNETFADVGGLEDVKSLFWRSIINPMKGSKEDRKLIPSGVLLMGPSGTGKTLLAKAIAGECGVIFIKLDPSSLFDKYVGETEKKLRSVIRFIKAIGKCFVFIDEIDQSLTGRGENNDNGVQNRFFSTFMQFLSDTEIQGEIVVIAATNRPDLLDAALIRDGRLDYKIIIPAPSKEECTLILKVRTEAQFHGSGREDYPTDDQYAAIANQMVDYTGAEIGSIAKKALRESKYLTDLSIYQLLEKAFNTIIPTTQNIQKWTNLALGFCNDMDMIPERLMPQKLAMMAKKPGAQSQSQKEIEPIEEETGRRARRED
jgi:transitional endoplasmic reticulum ATPase